MQQSTVSSSYQTRQSSANREGPTSDFTRSTKSSKAKVMSATSRKDGPLGKGSSISPATSKNGKATSRSPQQTPGLLKSSNAKAKKFDRETLVTYSLAMSTILQRGDVSGQSLDEDERLVYNEMAKNFGKE